MKINLREEFFTEKEFVLAENKSLRAIAFRYSTGVAALKIENAKVVYQGLEGAYAHDAVCQYFGEDCDMYHVETWRDAMEEVKEGRADYAVLPIENSTAGIVSQVYDLLVEYDNYIVGETFVKVEHALLGTKDATIEDIERVYSHPQSLMQSAKFLEEHRDWQQISSLTI